MPLDRNERKRSGPLTVVLAYIAFSNAWGAYRSIEIYWDLVSHSDPRFPHWPFLAIGILAIFSFVGVVGLWFWKKWGFFLLCISSVAALSVSIFLGVPIWVPLLGFTSLGILYALLRGEWNQFR